MVTPEITRGDGVTGIARTCRVCFLRSDRLSTIVRLNWSVIGASVRGSAAKNTSASINMDGLAASGERDLDTEESENIRDETSHEARKNK